MELNIQQFRQKLQGSFLDQFIIFLIAISPIFSFVVKGWINGCVILLAVLCTYSLIKKRNFLSCYKKNKTLILIATITLASNFIYVFFAQIFHTKINLSSFDAPLRILICIPIFLFLLKNKSDVIELLKWTLPLTILITFLYLLFNSNHYWGERFATKFVDPNALGSYVACITGLTMLTANRKTPHGLIHFFYWALWTCSLIAGVYIVIKAGTRGAFLATPIIVYAFIQYITSSKKLKFLISILFISLLTITYLSNSYLQYRTQDGILEIKHWLDKTQTETSAGFRLSMFEISIEIFKEKPLAGYGEFGYEEALRKIEKKGRYSSESIQIMIDAGPHSTLFETAVNYGLIGLFGYLFLMLTPTAIFLRDKSIKKWRGLCFMFSLILMGQSINIITLKYTSSIFGFFLSILLADALNKKQTVAIAGNA